ncbi:hypothetical protein LPJ61_006862, partial [Coemansia biformis]
QPRSPRPPSARRRLETRTWRAIRRRSTLPSCPRRQTPDPCWAPSSAPLSTHRQ